MGDRYFFVEEGPDSTGKGDGYRPYAASLTRPKARNRATETRKIRFNYGIDVKRGNLHPEQHQIGIRAVKLQVALPSMRVGG